MEKILDTYLSIELYYIDKSICGRAKETIDVIEEAVSDLEDFINENNITVVFQAIEVKTREEAIKNNIKISPTIRINDLDFNIESLSGRCDYCSETLDSDLDCSEWEYNGLRFNIIPKILLKEYIIGSLNSKKDNLFKKSENISELNENLLKYFRLKEEYEKKLIELKANKKSCCGGNCSC